MNDVTLEHGLIATLIQNPELIEEVSDRVNEEDFSDDRMRKIYSWCLERIDKGKKVTPVSFHKFCSQNFTGIEKDTIVNNVSNTPYLSKSGIDDTVEQLNNLKMRRRIRQAADKVNELAKNKEMEIEELQAKAQDIVFRASALTTDKKTIYDIEDVLVVGFEAFTRRMEGIEEMALSTGYPTLDYFLSGGLRKGHLTVIGGSTSMGKTAFALNIIRNIMLKDDVPQFVLSMEMTKTEIADRFLIQEARIPAHRFYGTKIEDTDRTNLAAALDRLHKKNVKISDERGLSIEDIKAKCRRVNREFDNNLRVVVVDYLHQIRVDSHDLVKGYGDAVLELKNLAGELDCTVILVSQLNREVSKRDSKRPRINDLRASGEIEEKADEVILVYRPDYYKQEKESDIQRKREPEEAEVAVAKGRTSGTGKAKFIWYPEILYFNDYFLEQREGPLIKEG